MTSDGRLLDCRQCGVPVNPAGGWWFDAYSTDGWWFEHLDCTNPDGIESVRDRRCPSDIVGDEVPVTCWCERRFLLISRAEWQRGARTGTCGSPDCKPPKETTA